MRLARYVSSSGDGGSGGGGEEGGRLFVERVDRVDGRGIVGPASVDTEEGAEREMKERGEILKKQEIKAEILEEDLVYRRRGKVRGGGGGRVGGGRGGEDVDVDATSISEYVCFDPFHCPRYDMRRRFFSRSRHRVDKGFLGLSRSNNPTSR